MHVMGSPFTAEFPNGWEGSILTSNSTERFGPPAPPLSATQHPKY
jgi:hypothetical protein